MAFLEKEKEDVRKMRKEVIAIYGSHPPWEYGNKHTWKPGTVVWGVTPLNPNIAHEDNSRQSNIKSGTWKPGTPVSELPQSKFFPNVKRKENGKDSKIWWTSGKMPQKYMKIEIKKESQKFGSTRGTPMRFMEDGTIKKGEPSGIKRFEENSFKQKTKFSTTIKQEQSPMGRTCNWATGQMGMPMKRTSERTPKKILGKRLIDQLSIEKIIID